MGFPTVWPYFILPTFPFLCTTSTTSPTMSLVVFNSISFSFQLQTPKLLSYATAFFLNSSMGFTTQSVTLPTLILAATRDKRLV
ncbi:hypothetical protein PPACK8108_LOCUS21407 [Phakopsora pachyrhizi]|uniref:Secreted protein n=1 Tax=Phakopsora pachyrhizi TaxID=170000 RepID=A0AAV0BJU8_PHAPC|nr:hypothetical protein PPACK8108_LOCUS21407 [Phakopsora pachyrhizi]